MKNLIFGLGITLATLLGTSDVTAASYKAVIVPDLGGTALLNFDTPMKTALANYVYAIYKTSGNQRMYIRFNEADVTFYAGISGLAKLMAPPYPLVVTGYKGAIAGQIHINASKASQFPFVNPLYIQPAESKIKAGGQRTYSSLAMVKNYVPIALEISASSLYTPDVISTIIEQVKNELKDL